MEKKSAIVIASMLFSATQAVHADIIDTFTRSDGPVATDSIGLTESGSQKYRYMERTSPNGPDFVNQASIVNNGLLISGTNAGTTQLSRDGAPGLVYLEGYNSPYLTVSADISFDSGSYNNNTATILATPATGATASLLTSTAGFILRAAPNLDFNSPGNATQQGQVDVTMGSNGDFLIRELSGANALATVYTKNPFSNAGSTHRPLPGKLPASINGIPFDANQDGLLEPNETFNLSVKIFASGAGFDIVQPFIDGMALGTDPVNNPAGGTLAFNGSASGINGIALLKNRTSSGGTFSVVSNPTFDNLAIDTLGSGPTTETWNVDSDGTWSTGSNWDGGSRPFAVDSVANFGSAISGPHTISLDTTEIVGTLNFNSANPYTLQSVTTSTVTGTTTATVTTSVILSSIAGPVGINVAAGTQTIAAGVEMQGDGTIAVASGSSLAITGTLLAPGRTLTTTGPGPLQFGAIKVGTFSLTGGNASITMKTTANTTSGTSVVNALSIPTGSKLDLTNNDMILDYSNGGIPDPAKLTFMKNLIVSGYANGAWTGTGLTSSDAATIAADPTKLNKTALGFAEASAAGITTFDGTAVDNDAIVVRYTYTGDANLNGAVNTADFVLLSNNFGATGATWVQGDFNYDGMVNALDFNILATNFGATSPIPGLSLGSVVPEPASIGLLGLAFVATQLRRRRRLV